MLKESVYSLFSWCKCIVASYSSIPEQDVLRFYIFYIMNSMMLDMLQAKTICSPHGV